MLVGHLDQDATWWAEASVDSTGDPVQSAPVAIKVRWQQKAVVYRGADGSEQRADNVVYCDRDIPMGSYLLLGTSTDATPPAGTLKVKDREYIKGFDNESVLYKVML